MIGRLYILAAAIIITAACTAGSGNTGSSAPDPQQPVEDLTPAPASTQQEQILVSKGVKADSGNNSRYKWKEAECRNRL